MIREIKGFVAKMLANFVPNAVFEQLKKKHVSTENYGQNYYSQEGEEIILRRFFKYKNKGFFVDVGAHHPMRFSNTYLLYQMGWRGINIDATPGSMKNFNQHRKEDINIEAGISNNNEVLYFYNFDEPALNTFDENKAKQITSSTAYKLLSKQEIKTTTLAIILDKNVKENQQIDFFSIDVEGFDLNVLESNNWKKYKPKVIVVESSNIDMTKLNSDKINLLLDNYGYKPFAKTYKSVFYYC
jgi:FkbM family methyltransferase